MAKLAPEILTKTTTEAITVHFDFSREFAAGETINSVVKSATPSNITIGNHYISSDGKTVQVRVSGGTDRTSYLINVQVQTNLGNTIEGSGRVDIQPVANF